jgi:hypothetical protein
MTDHIPGCAQLNRRPCFNRVALEGISEHQWSGWPGAHCLVCYAEDPDEICLADSCRCPCHDDLWTALERMQATTDPVHPIGCVCERCSVVRSRDWGPQ